MRRPPISARFILLVVGFLFSYAAGQSLPGQSLFRQMQVVVKDIEGRTIPDAVVNAGGLYVDKTNFNGVARFDAGPGLRTPILLSISAPGFESARSMLDHWPSVEVEVRLRRLPAESFARGKAVTLGELSAEVQRKSEKLQQEGLAALQRGEHQQAEKLLLSALELTPSNFQIYNNLGVAYARQRKIGSAAASFERALELQPLDLLSTGNLGLIRYLQKRRSESFELLSQAVSWGFSEPSAHYVLGIMALENGDWQRSAEQLALTPVERFPKRDLFLTAALYQLRREKSARRSFMHFIRRNPAPLDRANRSSIEGGVPRLRPRAQPQSEPRPSERW